MKSSTSAHMLLRSQLFSAAVGTWELVCDTSDIHRGCQM